MLSRVWHRTSSCLSPTDPGQEILGWPPSVTRRKGFHHGGPSRVDFAQDGLKISFLFPVTLLTPLRLVAISFQKVGGLSRSLERWPQVNTVLDQSMPLLCSPWHRVLHRRSERCKIQGIGAPQRAAVIQPSARITDPTAYLEASHTRPRFGVGSAGVLTARGIEIDTAVYCRSTLL